MAVDDVAMIATSFPDVPPDDGAARRAVSVGACVEALSAAAPVAPRSERDLV